ISDHGSGFDLGQRALQVMAGLIDGLQGPTILTDMLRDEFELPTSRDDLVAWVYFEGRKPNASATLAPYVLKAAEAGDAQAMDFIEDSASKLVEYYTALCAHLDMTSAPVLFTGGLLFDGSPYAHTLMARLGLEAYPAPLQPPVAGAARVAKLAIDARTTQ
ncbi:MAG: hypothetical protein AAF125_00715, partial [Chloroflexota bacterium]